MHAPNEKTSWNPTVLDMRMAVCILVCCLASTALTGTARMWYALFRLLSTVFGAIVVWGVTSLMSGTGGTKGQ